MQKIIDTYSLVCDADRLLYLRNKFREKLSDVGYKVISVSDKVFWIHPDYYQQAENNSSSYEQFMIWWVNQSRGTVFEC